MSNYETSPPSGKATRKNPQRTKATRSPSVSEIAKNTHQFEIWCTYQNLERAAYEDIPESFKADVDDIFNLRECLPISWVTQGSQGYKLLSSFASPEFVAFIAQAYKEEPSLFGSRVKDEDIPALYLALTKPFTAWNHVRAMLSAKERWSEADFADVYTEFRRPAILKSTSRTQCCVSLPEPPVTTMGFEAARILSARRCIPDCITMIPAKAIRHLSNSTKSPFKQLKNHKSVKRTGSSTKDSSFAYQATVRYSIPDVQGFEFVSSVWEDKKPAHEYAYRQNRMSTAAVARHLHSMHVDAPVFGLTWACGYVRAHIDWCKQYQQDDHPAVYSAPYIRAVKSQCYDDKDYHEWHLDRAGDILQLHFLIVNIDDWTTGKFVKRVVAGITDLEKSIVMDKQPFEPWRRSEDIRPRRSLTLIDQNLSSGIISPKAKTKMKLRGTHGQNNQ